MKGLGRRPRFPALATLLCGLWTATAPAYYHYLHFRSGAAGAERRPERFDLAELTDGRLLFYVSRSERPLLAPNDSWEGVLSQIRRALDVWNEVPSAALRVGFGGMVDEEVPGDAPAAMIAFAELPPGVLGLGGPTVKGEPRDGMVPIRRSQVVLTKDLASGPRGRQSFSELFFSTLTHEIGHALGLQHSLSGSAMTTDPTRSTTRALPIGEDDFAGLAALYPPAEASRRVGAIAGRVAFASGEPVFLASVAAIHAGGAVVTALTDPDGSYRIEGLSPGGHLVYVQPLPPATQEGLGPANLVMPTFEDGSSPPVRAFRAMFHGGADRPENSPRVAVRQGAATGGVDFTPRPAAEPDLRAVTTFSFPGNDAPGVHPAFVNLTTDPGMILATGPGLIEQGGRTRVTSVLRDVAVSAPTPYERDRRFARLDLAAAPFEGFGPLHLMFQTPNDFYVLPAAARLTPIAAPVIYWIVEDFAVEGLWRLRGDRLDLQSAVFFDGQPAEIVGFDDFLGELLVRPPPGPPGRRAVVTAFNPDGQSSAFTLPDGNVVFEYPRRNAPGLAVRAAGGAPGEDILIEVSGGVGFEAGRVDLGIGSSAVVVRAAEVLAPDRVAAVATIRPDASPGVFPITVVNGLDIQVFEDAFRVESSASAATTDSVPRVPFNGLVHAATGRPELAPGVLATLRGERLALAGDVRVTFNGAPARLLSITPQRIDLVIPENLQPGAAEMKVFNGVAASGGFPVRLRSFAPGLLAASLPDGRPLDAASPPGLGEAIELLATGVPTASGALDSAVLRILVETIPAAPDAVEPTSEPGVQRIRFTIPRANVLSRAVDAEVVILLDGRRSNPLRLPLR